MCCFAITSCFFISLVSYFIPSSVLLEWYEVKLKTTAKGWEAGGRNLT